jgi:hypothetical protein
MNMGIMTNSVAPTTVGDTAAKGSVSASTNAQPTFSGQAYTGPKVLELNVVGKINTADERTFASFTAKGLSSNFGTTDGQTGNIKTTY